MDKTEVYSWRLDPDLKQRLEEAARAEKTSVGSLLDRIARAWLGAGGAKDNEAQQRRLHALAEKVIGTVPLRRGPYTRERVREAVRARLTDKRQRRLRDAPPRSD
jgi:hypothetical protein